MRFFIVATSFAAPFFSDTDYHYAEAQDYRAALNTFAKTYKHPFGLYAAQIYESADGYHQGNKPLGTWLSNHAAEYERVTKAIKGGYSSIGNGPGDFVINGKRHLVRKPKSGSVVA